MTRRPQLPLPLPPRSLVESWKRVRATALRMLAGKALPSDVIAEQERHVRVWEEAQSESIIWL